MYGMQITMSVDNVAPIMATAIKLEIDILEKTCVEYLHRYVLPDPRKTVLVLIDALKVLPITPEWKKTGKGAVLLHGNCIRALAGNFVWMDELGLLPPPVFSIIVKDARQRGTPTEVLEDAVCRYCNLRLVGDQGAGRMQPKNFLEVVSACGPVTSERYASRIFDFLEAIIEQYPDQAKLVCDHMRKLEFWDFLPRKIIEAATENPHIEPIYIIRALFCENDRIMELNARLQDEVRPLSVSLMRTLTLYATCVQLGDLASQVQKIEAASRHYPTPSKPRESESRITAVDDGPRPSDGRDEPLSQSMLESRASSSPPENDRSGGSRVLGARRTPAQGGGAGGGASHQNGFSFAPTADRRDGTAAVSLSNGPPMLSGQQR